MVGHEQAECYLPNTFTVAVRTILAESIKLQRKIYKDRLESKECKPLPTELYADPDNKTCFIKVNHVKIKLND